MPDKIQFRRDTAANWRTYNPTLAAGEPAFETDARQFKIGDGVNAWNLLPYTSRPDPSIAGGRLSLTRLPTSAPYPGFAHATPQTILYYVPYRSNLISLWSNGIGWRVWPFDNNTAISLVGLPGNTNYDVFAYVSNGSVQLALTAWGDDWTRATIPAFPVCGTSGIQYVEGVFVQCGNTPYRYLGTIRTSAEGGSTHDTYWRRFVYNHYNQIPTTTLYQHGIAHTYASSFWRQWDGGSYGDSVQTTYGVNKIQMVTGVPCPIEIKLSTYMRYGNVAVMVYGFAAQRHGVPSVWLNGVQPYGDFTGYGYLSTNVNIVNPTPLGGGSVISQSTSVTYGRNQSGLVEFWTAEYGYSDMSWFLTSTLSATALM